MNVTQLIFSPTGGVRRTARLLSEGLGNLTRVIDLTALDVEKIVLNPQELAVIALPSYSGRVPALAAQQLAKVEGGGAACVLLCVYGNRAYEDTLAEMEDLAKAGGFRVIGAVAAVAEHSILRQYAAGRPDSQDAVQLKAFAQAILSKRNRRDDPSIPGNRPYKQASSGGMIPLPAQACVNCGLCARQCPAQAIDRLDSKKVDENRCIHCMRCISVCPQKVRAVNPERLAGLAARLEPLCAVRKENELFL